MKNLKTSLNLLGFVISLLGWLIAVDCITSGKLLTLVFGG